MSELGCVCEAQHSDCYGITCTGHHMATSRVYKTFFGAPQRTRVFSLYYWSHRRFNRLRSTRTRVYSSCSMYLCLISFHCFYSIERGVSGRPGKQHLVNTHSLIPTVPEGVSANVQANSKRKCPSDDRAKEHACKVEPTCQQRN